MVVKHKIPKSKLSKFNLYWDDLDEVKLLPANEFKKIQQEIRSAIIDVLTTGVHDSNTSSHRYVLSATEIKAEIRKILGYEVKKANIYFHLQVLEEINAIQIVDTLTFNKKLTAYYGRTAKVFLLTGKTEKKELQLLESKKFVEFLTTLNPDVPKTRILDILQNIMGISEHDTSNIVSWLDEHSRILKNSQIEFAELYKLITFLKIDNPKVRMALNELSTLLKLNNN